LIAQIEIGKIRQEKIDLIFRDVGAFVHRQTGLVLVFPRGNSGRPGLSRAGVSPGKHLTT
jgi:hypothetical protein